MNPLSYNKKSSLQYGWDLSWFGAARFDEVLLTSIKRFQLEHGLTPDGLVGPLTYRRIFTERFKFDGSFQRFSFDSSRSADLSDDHSKLIFGNRLLPIEWDKFINYRHPDGIQCKPGTYYDWSDKPNRNIKFFVNHWDATLSARHCKRIMDKRGFSIHFCIDNDGTIYQTLDLQHPAWQAGRKDWNCASIGVEISNAFYLKYQNWYVKHGFGERPIERGHRVHGVCLVDFLGFYPVQIEALKALWKACHEELGIPLEVPNSKGVDQQCRDGNFYGFINHYNLLRKKIDCASLDMHQIRSELLSVCS